MRASNSSEDGRFALIEADDPVAISKFCVYWADLVDIKVVPVIDDGEMAQALGA